jgi:SAM-dependent methyltransferase
MSQVREAWQSQLRNELTFWDQYLRTRGERWPGEFERRTDPDDPLVERQILSRIRRRHLRRGRDKRPCLRILDVGAGPLTILGKRLDDVKVEITAVDPLAGGYNALLQKYQIIPPVRTQWCEGEQLAARFRADSFDFAYARNALDHAHDPRVVIEQMVIVTRPGGWVILRHYPNEAQAARYKGLHQWNFQLRDDQHFWITGHDASYDMTAALDHVAAVTCFIDSPWLICAIRKRRRRERILRRLIGR